MTENNVAEPTQNSNGRGTARSDTDPITQDEVYQLFGEELPMEAVQLLWNGSDETTVGELRAKLRDLARRRVIDAKTEAVARAICEADGRDPNADWRAQGNVFLTVHDPHPELWRRYLKHAAAAIAAGAQ